MATAISELILEALNKASNEYGCTASWKHTSAVPHLMGLTEASVRESIAAVTIEHQRPPAKVYLLVQEDGTRLYAEYPDRKISRYYRFEPFTTATHPLAALSRDCVAEAVDAYRKWRCPSKRKLFDEDEDIKNANEDATTKKNRGNSPLSELWIRRIDEATTGLNVAYTEVKGVADSETLDVVTGAMCHQPCVKISLHPDMPGCFEGKTFDVEVFEDHVLFRRFGADIFTRSTKQETLLNAYNKWVRETQKIIFSNKLRKALDSTTKKLGDKHSAEYITLGVVKCFLETSDRICQQASDLREILAVRSLVNEVIQTVVSTPSSSPQ